MTRLLSAIALVGATCLHTTIAAQTPPAPDVGDMSLRELLDVEVVSAASRFSQEVTEAPGSITVIRADEIRRLGYRTLGDVIGNARGFYKTYDRNYTYIGVRGFGRPGDYNSRILLLVDGHRLNDAIYNMAPFGTDFPVALSLVDRVEIIRGPGSSLYGTNAVFAVINVITRTGRQLEGTRIETYGGSQSTLGVSASVGRLFESGADVLVSGYKHHSDGVSRIYFPQFDDGQPGAGVATGLDDDDAVGAFASATLGRVSLRSAWSRRRKQIPTASFGSVFGDGREETADTTGYARATYDGPLGRHWSATASTAFDYYAYHGLYPIAYEDAGTVLWDDQADSRMITAEATVSRRLSTVHRVTVGTEFRNQFHNHQWGSDGITAAVDVNRPGTALGIYAQDEIRLARWLLVNAGLRFDRYPRFAGGVTPRYAVVLMPRDRTTIKLLHGRAFRAPSSYELYFYEPVRDGRVTLRPERVRSTEVVWEERVAPGVHTTVSAFEYRVAGLIEQRAVPGAPSIAEEFYFANMATVRAHGVEGEIEARWAGAHARASYTFVTGEDGGATPMSNSPHHLAKASLELPLAAGAVVGLDAHLVGARGTLGGGRVDPYFVPNLTVTTPLGRALELSFSLYNLTNASYADPVGSEHVAASIPQDGRTFRLRASVRF